MKNNLGLVLLLLVGCTFAVEDADVVLADVRAGEQRGERRARLRQLFRLSERWSRGFRSRRRASTS